MTAAERYAATLDAVAEQRGRLLGRAGGGGRWDRAAGSFRMDPRRELDANTAAVAAFVQPGDVVVDVGGGAGRISLPLAAGCREVVNVDPSPGMCEQFRESAAEAGIGNARAVEAAWPAEGIAGDLVLAFNVTYFIREIVPFVEALNAAARRRVVIGCWTVPPPNHIAGLFAAVMDEPFAPYPGAPELLPVLWELGIFPDVRALPNPFPLRQPRLATESEVIDYYLDQLQPAEVEPARARMEAQFEALFAQNDQGYYPLWRPNTRELLITWALTP